MKKVLLTASLLVASLGLFAQSNSIPNPSFENWTYVAYQDPINCQTSNDQNSQNSNPISVFRVADAYHGKYAIQMKTVKFGADTDASYFAIGNPGGGGGPSGGSPISGTPTGIRLYYKFTVKSADTAFVLVEFKKAGAVINQYLYQIYDTTSTYKLFSQTFSPALSQTPDSIVIACASSTRIISKSNGGSNGWAPGSIYQVDSVTFTGIATQPKNFDGDFENWQNDTLFSLTGWNISANGDSLPMRTNDAYAGKYAVELATSYSNCNSCSSNVQATEITTGKTNHNGSPTGGLPYSLQKDTLEFVYKFSSPKNLGDSAYVGLQFHNSSNSKYYDVYLDTASHYRKVDVPFDMTTLFTPDSVLIDIYSSITRTNNGGLPVTDLGAVLKIDSMHFKSQLSISTVPANPAFCSGTGGVKITASGATSYTWSPNTGLSATTGASVTANPFSNQTYTITGTNGGLVGTQTVVVTVNFPPTVNITPTSASICSGNSVNLTASGASVSYTWSPATGLNVTTGAKVSANPTGTQVYTATGMSAAGCSGANAVTVTVTTTPTVTVLPTSAIICSGGGAATLRASGATNYTWKPAAGLSTTTGATVQANPTVTTTYTLIGSNGSCTDSITVKVRVDKTINPNLTTTNVSCNGDCNGTSSCGTTGGTSPYTYLWASAQTGSAISNLCQGSYSVTITDSLGCTATASVTVTQPQSLLANATGIPTTCGQSNGEGITNPSGGTGPYSYSWNSNPLQTTQNATGLAAGKYTVVVTDANKCTDTAKVTIAASSAPTITVKVTPSNCGTHNGIATATVSGGATPYKYSWNNGATNPSVDSLAAGVYIITVTDKNGCSSFQAVTVSDTNGPSLSVTSITQNKCHGQSIGAISVTATGGKTPYHYFWSNGATTTSISGLPAGPYQVTVTDGTGCSDVKTITITAPAAITLTPSSTQANCKVADGGASILVSGGTSPFVYSWNNAATTSAVGNVAAGTYTVIITDNNGCKDSADVSVSNASGPIVKIISVVSDSCTAKGSSGSISISDSAGLSPYTYAWSNGATTSNITGLAAGSYAVTVTDAAGCIGTINGTVKQVQPPAISICMVTVNPVNNQNQVIWNKSFTQRIAKYNVYKETTSPGVFGLVGSVKADSTCIFNDTLSNALVRSWRYEISQVDSCGNESPLSLPHKTMHLTINQGIGSTINLIWDNYQGLNFGYYIVYRDTMPGVAQDSINYMTNNNTYTLSDSPPYSATHSWYYHMGINNPGGCNPAIESINYNAAKSNTGNFTLPSGIAQVDAEAGSLEIFPNPSTGMVSMSIFLASEKQNITVKVINTMGQVLWSDKYDDVAGNLKKRIDMSLYSKGLYIIQVTTNNSSMFRKVVIQ